MKIINNNKSEVYNASLTNRVVTLANREDVVTKAEWFGDDIYIDLENGVLYRITVNYSSVEVYASKYIGEGQRAKILSVTAVKDSTDENFEVDFSNWLLKSIKSVADTVVA